MQSGTISKIRKRKTWQHVSGGPDAWPMQSVTSLAKKLTAEDVIEIRRLYETGTKQVDIALLYKLSRGTISGIITGKTWKHVQ